MSVRHVGSLSHLIRASIRTQVIMKVAALDAEGVEQPMRCTTTVILTIRRRVKGFLWL
jgi:hypothetical protein